MFLKNKNIIFKIRRSKVTDYAALNFVQSITLTLTLLEVFLMSCDCKCSVAFPCDAVGFSAVCDFGISFCFYK